MEWKTPQIESYMEKDLLAEIEIKAQYHDDGFVDEVAAQHLDA